VADDGGAWGARRIDARRLALRPSSTWRTEVNSRRRPGAPSQLALSTSWSPHKPPRLDWLHIPKCGTTFLHHLLHFNCDKEISKDLGHRYDDEALALEYANYSPYLKSARYGGRHYSCQGGLRYYHRPITPEHGHHTTPVENVVSFFHDPISQGCQGRMLTIPAPAGLMQR
jgi:hypothetical protein